MVFPEGKLAWYSVLLLVPLILLCGKREVSSASAMTPCPAGKPNGLYPHPTDCGAFITCLDGTYHIQACPETLHFNPEDQVCDWPDNVRCLSATPQELASFNQYGAGHPGGRIMARLVEQFNKGDLSFQCQTEQASVPLEQDCGLFVRCQQWRSFLVTCPEQWMFSPKDGRCVPESALPDTAHCVRRADFRCPTAQGIFPDRRDRRKYYNCWSFRWYHQTCPKGLVFNDKQKWCDYSWNMDELPPAGSADSAGIPVAELQRPNPAGSGMQPGNNNGGSQMSITAQLPPSGGFPVLNNNFLPQNDPPLQNNAGGVFLQNQQPMRADDGLPHFDGRVVNADGNVLAQGVNFAVQSHPHFTSQHQQPQLQSNGLMDPFLQSMPGSNGDFRGDWKSGFPDGGHHNRERSGFQAHEQQLHAPVNDDPHMVMDPAVGPLPGMQQLFHDFVRQRFLPSYTMANSTRHGSHVDSAGHSAERAQLAESASQPRKFHINFRTPETPLPPRHAVDLAELSAANVSANNTEAPEPSPLNSNLLSSAPQLRIVPAPLPSLPAVPVNALVPGELQPDWQKKRVGIRRYFNNSAAAAKLALPWTDLTFNRYLSSVPFG
ncbi:uncharacterized protein LOC129601266 [Paramacrobiotus metropolitanus]|uniref:uncharacterized protein LOC129601266 n=1 Tax=Paramacrobiotus metropolitanus TaxID=2943436 RepID=UPI002445686F|nr:uncharacterized protein LOC129601266 [Paramacrobiotus metropolitanus]